VWHATDDHPTKERHGGFLKKNLDGFYGFLLDGQQRLTSLSLAVRGESDGDLSTRSFFDVENECFYLGRSTQTVSKRVAHGDPLLVPLSDLVFTDNKIRRIQGMIDAIKERRKAEISGKVETTYRERLDRIAGLYDREVLCETFPEKTEEEAFELFSRLNKGGTTLSAGDVEGARLSSAHTKKIVGPMRAVAAEREMKAAGINFIFLLRCLVTVHRGNCSFSKLPKNWADDSKQVEQSWRSAEAALRATLKFARTELGWATRRWVPSIMAFIPVVFLLSQHRKESLQSSEKQHLREYLLLTGLRAIFRGSTETTVNSYVNAIRKSERRFSDACRALSAKVPANQRYKIKPEEIRTTSGMYAALMQVYLAFLVSSNAKSWPSGRSLEDIIQQELPNDPLAVHHIFPKRFMDDFPPEKLNTMANYAILSQADNAVLGDRDPFEVWRSLRSNQREWATAQLCFGVAKEDLLNTQEYEDFISFRAEQLADKLNGYLDLRR
jgi:hypothetical protein